MKKFLKAFKRSLLLSISLMILPPSLINIKITSYAQTIAEESIQNEATFLSMDKDGLINIKITSYAQTIAEESIQNEATFLSMDKDGLINIKIDGKKKKVRLINTIFSSQGKDEEVSRISSDAIKKVNESLKDKTIYLENDLINTDEEDSLLSYVWLKKPSKKVTKDEFNENCLNGLLAASGISAVYPSKVNNKYNDLMENAENIAIKNKVGIFNLLNSNDLEKLREDYNVKTEKWIETKGEKDKTIKETKAAKTTDTTKASKEKGKIKGNTDSKIYHLPGQQFYNKLDGPNIVYFDSEEEAQAAGYRKSKR